MHYYQSDYDRRWAYTKYREPGAEPLIMYESGAVWAEKFMNNGEYSYSFVGEKLPTFLMSLECKLDIWRKLDNKYGWKNAWQQHGYAQSFFLEHATRLKDNKSIAKLYQDWYDKGGTTFECLKRWAPDIIKTLTFDEYFVAAGTGKVSSLVKFPNIVNGGKKRADSNGATQMNCTVYPYGGIINEFTILGKEYLNPNGEYSLDGQIIRIKHTSKNTGIEVYTYDSVTKEWVRLGGLLTNDEEVVISGDELNKMRAVKNKVPSNLGIYVLCYSEWHEKAEDDAITITLEEKKNVEVEPSKPQEFEAEGGTVTLTVKTNQPSFTYEKDKDWPDWLKVEINKDDFTMEVTAAPNTSSTERKYTITVYALDAKGNKVGLPEEVEVTQRPKSKILSVSLSVTAYGFDGITDIYCGKILQGWGNDNNKTEVVGDVNNGAADVSCEKVGGTLKFSLLGMDKLKEGEAEIAYIFGSGDSWSLEANGSHGNSYKEDGNSITCAWNLGKITKANSPGITKIGTMEYDGTIVVTFSK
jgi:hypothetical protein